MTMMTVDLTTRDGQCRASVFRPHEGQGPWPAVVFCMDGLGYRATLFEMAERLAGHGYVVILPDLFHRAGPYEPDQVRAQVFNAETRPQWRERYYDPATKLESVRADIGAALDFLAAQPDVAQPKVGTTGYCMGGRISLMAAGCFPDRVAAAASFHGGMLAADDPGSPHALAPQMKARVYVAAATDDSEAMQQQLDEALTKAGVEHEMETYPARHGFAVPDVPAFDAAAAERHWTKMVELFDRALKVKGAR